MATVVITLNVPAVSTGQVSADLRQTAAQQALEALFRSLATQQGTIASTSVS